MSNSFSIKWLYIELIFYTFFLSEWKPPHLFFVQFEARVMNSTGQLTRKRHSNQSNLDATRAILHQFPIIFFSRPAFICDKELFVRIIKNVVKERKPTEKEWENGPLITNNKNLGRKNKKMARCSLSIRNNRPQWRERKSELELPERGQVNELLKSPRHKWLSRTTLYYSEISIIESDFPPFFSMLKQRAIHLLLCSRAHSSINPRSSFQHALLPIRIGSVVLTGRLLHRRASTGQAPNITSTLRMRKGNKVIKRQLNTKSYILTF